MRKALVVLFVILKMDNFVSTQGDYYDSSQVRFQNENLTLDSTQHDTQISQNVLIAADCPLEPVLTAALSVAAEK